MPRAVATAALFAAAVALVPTGCVKADPPRTASLLGESSASGASGASGAASPYSGPPATFAYDSLDERPVSDAATRGKPTLLAFVTTGSLSAQAQVDFLVAMSKHDADAINYAVVALEGPDNRELVELYKKALAIPFPVSLADERTRAGGGPFGDVSGVPVLVLLDRAGRVAWRMDGRVVKSDEVRAAIRGL
jgi:hypothetical protein